MMTLYRDLLGLKLVANFEQILHITVSKYLPKVNNKNVTVAFLLLTLKQYFQMKASIL